MQLIRNKFILLGLVLAFNICFVDPAIAQYWANCPVLKQDYPMPGILWVCLADWWEQVLWECYVPHSHSAFPALSSFLTYVCADQYSGESRKGILCRSLEFFIHSSLNILHLNLSVIVFPDSVLSPQLRILSGSVMGLFLASQLKDSCKVVSWENHKDLFSLFSVFFVFCFLWNVCPLLADVQCHENCYFRYFFFSSRKINPVLATSSWPEV